LRVLLQILQLALESGYGYEVLWNPRLPSQMILADAMVAKDAKALRWQAPEQPVAAELRK
jgi:hypothetical protein